MRVGSGSARRAAVAALAAAFIGLPALVAPAPALAQTQSWPQRPVKFVLPFGAGSATDVAARLMTDRLQAKWGQPVVIENKPGADGLLAINAFLQAVRSGGPAPIDACDAAAWSAIIPLSAQSIAEGSRPVEVPDFTEGAWETRAAK